MSQSEKEHFIAGVDVGGTHTDAVIIGGKSKQIVAAIKVPSSPDILAGVSQAMEKMLTASKIDRKHLLQINIGTTQVLNALLQRQVTSVAVVRIALPSTTAAPPFSSWVTDKSPSSLQKAVCGGVWLVHGGNELNGREISPLDQQELTRIAREIKARNLRAAAITSVYGIAHHEHELAVANAIKAINPGIHISMSHQIGGRGLAGAEDNTIINATLCDVYQKIRVAVTSLRSSLQLESDAFISLNNGTIAPLVRADRPEPSSATPLHTINSGPTNSVIGGKHLVRNAKSKIIIDIGGTSADGGFDFGPKSAPALQNVQLGELTLTIPTLRTESIALGGTSIVTFEGNIIQIGPDTHLPHPHPSSRAFMPDAPLTVTDVALALKRITFDGAQLENVNTSTSPEQLQRADARMHEMLIALIRRLLHSVENKPEVVVLVGGAAKLFDPEIIRQSLARYITDVIVPENSGVANAIGAAMGEISGSHTGIYSRNNYTESEAIAHATIQAFRSAVNNGADEATLHVTQSAVQKSDYNNNDDLFRVSIEVAGFPSLKIDAANTQTVPAQLAIPQIASTSSINAPPRSGSPQIEQCADPVSDPVVTAKINTLMATLPNFTMADVNDMIIGSNLLGTGGGGPASLGQNMLRYFCEQAEQPATLKLLALSQLPDDARVVCVGIMGSPTVAAQKPASINEMSHGISIFQEITGRAIDALIAIESGGSNALFPFAASAAYFSMTKKLLPVIDADTMGRALPAIHMTTPCMQGVVKHHVAVLTTANHKRIVSANTAAKLEEKAREITVELGGIVFIVYMAMSGKEAKACCIPNTLSIARNIGRQYKLARTQGNEIIPSVNSILKDTDYKAITIHCTGRIIMVRIAEEQGFSIGSIFIQTAENKIYEVVFMNENIALRHRTQGTDYTEKCAVPNLITVIDSETKEPLPCSDYAFGKEVSVVSLDAPGQLRRHDALRYIRTDTGFYFKALHAFTDVTVESLRDKHPLGSPIKPPRSKFFGSPGSESTTTHESPSAQHTRAESDSATFTRRRLVFSTEDE